MNTYEMTNPAQQAFDVYLNGRNIDTVFYSGPVDADEVRRSLIDHDGYDSDIEVRKARRSRPLPERARAHAEHGRARADFYHENPAPRPVRIACYDNGGKTADRYTVVYLETAFEARRGGTYYECVGMSENPFHPQGFGQHGECQPGRHLGRKISFNQLPPDCQRLVLQDTGVDASRIVS